MIKPNAMANNKGAWDLTELRQEWAWRREAVRLAKKAIDISNMTRPLRDPVERAWLEARGLKGPFRETDRPH